MLSRTIEALWGVHISNRPFLKYNPLVLFTLEFLYFAYRHTWEVDPHHDGIMYTAAVGVYEGKIPNRDFFAQYGPISPVLQGFWFRFTEPTLWNLKVLTSLGLAIIGVLIYIGVKRRFSAMTAILLSICWVLTGPFGLPWSSVFSTIFILSSLLILNFVLSPRERRHTSISSLIVGLLLAISTYTRIHSIVVFIAVVFGLLILRERRKYFRVTVPLVIGFFSTFAIITILLFKTNALKPYLDQCILWASGAYAGGPKISLSYFTNLGWIPLFGMINLFIIWQIFKSKSSKSMYVYLILLGSILFYGFLLQFSLWQRSGPQTLRNLKVLAVTSGEKSTFAFNFTILSFFIILIICGFRNLTNNYTKSKGLGEPIIYFLITLSTLTQLYPFADEYHIAFVVPIILVASVFVIPEKYRQRAPENALQLWAIALIPVLTFNFFVNAKVPRYEFSSKTLSGMYGSWITAKPLDQTMIALEREVPGIKFNCADGIYAGAGGRYLSVDEKFVTWGPPSKSLEYFDREFLCYADDNVISSYVKSGWKVKFKVLWCPITGCPNISYWNVLLEKDRSSQITGGVL